MHVWLTPAELALFESILKHAGSYFEFGMGGSTVLADTVVDGPIAAIDPDRVWVEKGAQSLTMSGKDRRLTHIDIGPTGAWGYPVSEAHRDSFPRYHASLAATGLAPFDLYFVDGRFRVASCCQVFLHMRVDSIVAIHDYRSREHYHTIEKFLRPVAECEDLTVLVKRESARRDVVEAPLAEHAFDVR